MEEGIYKIVVYKDGHAPGSNSEVKGIHYISFRNDKDGNGIGEGVIPEDIEEREFRKIDPERDRECLEYDRIESVNFPFPLEHMKMYSIALFVSCLDLSIANSLLMEAGEPMKDEGKVVMIERIRPLESLLSAI